MEKRPRKNEHFWTPVPVPDSDPGFAGVTALGTFYECIRYSKGDADDETIFTENKRFDGGVICVNGCAAQRRPGS